MTADPQSSGSTDPHDQPARRRRDARIGLILFAVYLSAYTAFVLLLAFAPAVMQTLFSGRINTAVGYGMLLIVGAFGLAILYLLLCRKPIDGGPR